jgi:predicted nucleic acid-binding protein
MEPDRFPGAFIARNLALYLRRRRLTFEQAFAIQSEAEALLADREYDVDSFDVLALARDSGGTAYDSEFVALARSLEVRMATGDAKLARAFPGLIDVLERRPIALQAEASAEDRRGLERS